MLKPWARKFTAAMLGRKPPNAHYEEAGKTHGTLRDQNDTTVSSRATVDKRSQPAQLHVQESTKAKFQTRQS